MRVPDFVLRQFYVAGSLANDADGFHLQARNGLGDGTIVGIGRIAVDGMSVAPEAVSARRGGDETVYRAADISRRSPVAFRRGDVVTFHVAGRPLAPGEHAFEVEIHELDLGTLMIAIRDTVG